MESRKPWTGALCRSLAVAYCIVGIVPLLFGVLMGGLLAGGHWWMPAAGVTSSWLVLIATQLLMPAAWGIWLISLAVRVWHPKPQHSRPLTWTGVLLLALGGLNCSWGYHAMQAAERSSSSGGGLLSPVALLPLVIGVPLVVIALLSVLAARRVAAFH
jgi:hypothetical protein